MLEPILLDHDQLDNYVAVCQLGITASSLLLGFYGQSRLAEIVRPQLTRLNSLQDAAAETVATTGVLLFLTTLEVLLGELVPKSIGVRFPERLALYTIVPMRWSIVLLRPLTWLFNGAGRLILRLLRVEQVDGHAQTHRAEEIELLVAESAKGGLLDTEEKVMLRNVFRLSGLVTHQVMIPRPRIEAAPMDIAPRDLLQLIADSPYTRIPIYEKDVDHIVGIVHLKDLFRVYCSMQDQAVKLEDYLREVPFVPEAMPVDELWNLLKSGHHYMAIVFDEYGGTAGLVTQEDLIEEVFGELQDEFDHEGPLIIREEHNQVSLRGDILVADVNEYLYLDLPEDRANTIGGLVINLLGRPAEVGDQVVAAGRTLQVAEVDDLAVSQVRLSLPADVDPILDGERAEET
jgi:CBS domain containing-hemolysin-like protein